MPRNISSFLMISAPAGAKAAATKAIASETPADTARRPAAEFQICLEIAMTMPLHRSTLQILVALYNFGLIARS
jgi:hypothetical protein